MARSAASTTCRVAGLVLVGSLGLSAAGVLVAQDNGLETILEDEASALAGWGRVPEFVRETREQNAKKKSIEQIRNTDLAWVYATGETAFMRVLLNNECSKKLEALVAGDDLRREAMVMDNQGALVCASGRTSDYWQGDEDKWLKSFGDGSGVTYIAEPSFDDSVGAVLVQISVPLIDGQDTIGVVTIGLDLEELKRRQGLR